MTNDLEIGRRRFDARSQKARRLIFNPHRLTGEDASRWLAIFLVPLGAAFALAASAMIEPQETSRHEDKAIPAPETSHGLAPVESPPLHSIVKEESPTPVDQPQERTATEMDASPIAGTASSGWPMTSQTIDCPQPINIQFAYGSARFVGGDLDAPLKALAEWALQHDDATLSVEGHADPTGTEQGNVFLSFRRAKAVGSQLAAWGVPERRIIVRAAGASQSTGAPETASRDRRAVLRVEGVPNCHKSGDMMERQ